MANGGTGSGSSSWLIARSSAGECPFRRRKLGYDVDVRNRQGSASVFQFTLHKNLNAYHRIAGVPKHSSIHVKLEKEPL